MFSVLFHMKFVVKCLVPASFVSQRSSVNTKQIGSQRNWVVKITAFEALKPLVETGRGGKPFFSIISLPPPPPRKTGLLHDAAKGYGELRCALELQTKAHYKWRKSTTGNRNIVVKFQEFWTRYYKRNPSPSTVSGKTSFNIIETMNSPNMRYFFTFPSLCLLNLTLYLFYWIYCPLTLHCTWSHSFS